MQRDIRISPAAARVNAELTQAEAAKLLGITRKTLVQYENGTVMPKWDMVQKMSEVYGIPDGNISFRKKYA